MGRIDDRMLAVIRAAPNRQADDWWIASSIYPWDGHPPELSFRAAWRKHGAWITQVYRAGLRLQEKGLAGSYIFSHGQPGYNAPQSRIWFAIDRKPDPPVKP